MASLPTRISELTQVTPQSPDQIPIARGFGAGGQTLKVTVGSLVDKIKSDVEVLSGNTISVIDSPTIDLTYDNTTRQLSADLQMNLDLRSRTILLPSFIEIPPGCIMPFAGTAAPDGWVICNGDIVPNGVGPVQGKNYNYSRLWSVLGTTYGTTPGTLPDLRGYFIRGYGGTSPNIGNNADGTFSGAFGQKVADTFQGHKHDLYDPTHDHPSSYTGCMEYSSPNACGNTAGDTITQVNWSGNGYQPGNSTGTGGENKNINHRHSVILTADSTGVKVLSATGDQATAGAGDSNGPGGTTPRVGAETQPKNIALLYCIKV